VLESDRGLNPSRHVGPASKGIHESRFDYQHSRNTSYVEQLIMEEMKLQEMKESTRSAANIVDDESPEEYKKDQYNRKNNIKSLVEEF